MEITARDDLYALGYRLICDDEEKEMYERYTDFGGTDTVCFDKTSCDISTNFCCIEEEPDFSDEIEAIMMRAWELGWVEPLDPVC